MQTCSDISDISGISDRRAQATSNAVRWDVSRRQDELLRKGPSRWLTCVFASLRDRRSSTSLLLMVLITLSARVQAEQLASMDAMQRPGVALQGSMQYTLAGENSGDEPKIQPAPNGAADTANLTPARKLIVVGFLGGKVHATNLVHREAQLIGSLQQAYPRAIHAAIFANRDGALALQTVLKLLDEDKDGQLSDAEKSAARIVIFGHSWGASETVTLADRLNKFGIPVLLTIQVDSVQKQSQNDEKIPPNVREAVNFYQSEGLLRGRNLIVAADPERTRILGNHESSYRENSVSCAGFPWYARAFMKRHIQIENDPVVWGEIEALILARMF